MSTTSDKIKRKGEALSGVGAALDGLTLDEKAEVLSWALSAVEADRRPVARPQPQKAGGKRRSKCSPQGEAARAAAEVVAEHGTSTTQAVADALGLSVSAASHRLTAAAEGGLIRSDGGGVWRAVS